MHRWEWEGMGMLKAISAHLRLVANSVVNVIFDGFHMILQLIMVRLAGGGGILCRHAHSLLQPAYQSTI